MVKSVPDLAGQQSIGVRLEEQQPQHVAGGRNGHTHLYGWIVQQQQTHTFGAAFEDRTELPVALLTTVAFLMNHACAADLGLSTGEITNHNV